MTLNVMLTSRHAVYLSGDFRLTYMDDSFKDDLLVQKMIPVIKLNWCALVAFCGIAKTSTGIDVGDWIAEKVELNNKKSGLIELINNLKTAESWIYGRPPDEEKRLNICIVGFRGRKPFAGFLSNYQDKDGKYLPEINDKLIYHDLRPKTNEIRFFGDLTSIKENDKLHLKELLNSEKPIEIQNALADFNKKASVLSNTISKECVVGRIHPTGEGEIIPYEIDSSLEYMPDFVGRYLQKDGIIGFERKVDSDGKPLNPQWKGMTMKAQGKREKDKSVPMLHRFANVNKPISNKTTPSNNVFWKVAIGNEPKSLTIHRKKKH